jgi:hypothetical protein
MSILKEIHPDRWSGSWEDFDDLLDSLRTLIENGLVQEIPPSSDMRPALSERWFVDNATNVVFKLLGTC